MMIMFPLTFLSNAFVPADTLPPLAAGLRQASTRSPTSSPRSRDLTNDGAVTAEVGWALLGCVVVVAIFAPLAVRAYSRKM